jgi:hypothetical protein
VFGEMHPLQLGYRRFLMRGAVVAATAHLAAFSGWFVARRSGNGRRLSLE